MTLNDRYRNGGEMSETEPPVQDTVDFMRRTRQDYRVAANALREMGCTFDEVADDYEESE